MLLMLLLHVDAVAAGDVECAAKKFIWKELDERIYRKSAKKTNRMTVELDMDSWNAQINSNVDFYYYYENCKNSLEFFLCKL